jgi:anti-sigma factor RsiW
VSCDFASSLLQGYFDGELAPFRATEFERHLSHCTECATELVDLDLLSATLQLARLYAPTPPSLRRKVQANLRSAAVACAGSKPLLWHWLAAAAALLLFAIAGWRVNRNLSSNDYQGEFAEEIVEAHMTSLYAGNITGIASNDEGVVKGWVEGKARFAVPVHDFSKQGFQLRGARMDLVEGRTIAALVYAHGGHLINVFMWPTRERDTAAHEGSRQGFQWVDWRKGKMEFCTVSDTDPTDLQELHELINSSPS